MVINTKQRSEENKRKQRELVNAGYNIKIDGSWGPWQQKLYEKIHNKSFLSKAWNWFKNASATAAYVENPAVMTAAGWTPQHDGTVKLDAFNTPERNKLADNLAIIGTVPVTAHAVTSAPLTFLGSMAGGEAINGASIATTGKTFGENVSAVTGGVIPPSVGSFLNPGYVLGPKGFSSIYFQSLRLPWMLRLVSKMGNGVRLDAIDRLFGQHVSKVNDKALTTPTIKERGKNIMKQRDLGNYTLGVKTSGNHSITTKGNIAGSRDVTDPSNPGPINYHNSRVKVGEFLTSPKILKVANSKDYYKEPRGAYMPEGIGFDDEINMKLGWRPLIVGRWSDNNGIMITDFKRLEGWPKNASTNVLLPNKEESWLYTDVYKTPTVLWHKKGGTIHIKDKNKGKFTESAKRAGESVLEHARKVVNDPKATKLLKKRAQFALNAKKFKH